jgi:hypothetical protein
MSESDSGDTDGIENANAAGDEYLSQLIPTLRSGNGLAQTVRRGHRRLEKNPISLEAIANTRHR